VAKDQQPRRPETPSGNAEVPGGPDVRSKILISLLGVTGPPSGAWTRFEGIFPHVPALMPDVEFVVVSARPDIGQVLPLCDNVTLIRRDPDDGRLAMLRRTRVLHTLVRELQPDVIHLEAFPVVQQKTARTCVTWHDLREFDLSSAYGSTRGAQLKRWIQRQQAKRVDRIISVSEWTRSMMLDVLEVQPDRITVVPNPAPRPSGGAADTLDGWRPDQTSFVLALGHLEPRKNLRVLIEATRSAAWPSGCQLVIAGLDLGEGQALRRAAEGTDITFLGSVPEATKWGLLRGASCVLVPSTLEGFGLVALESLSVGTPVLAADCAALPEVVGAPETLLNPDDPEQWARQVAKILAEPSWTEQQLELQLQRAAHFSPARSAERLAEVYRSLLNPS